MDPNIALKELFEAVEAGDCDQVRESTAAINGWIAQRGYPPHTLGPWKLGLIWHIAVTKTVLRLAKAHVAVVASQAVGD